MFVHYYSLDSLLLAGEMKTTESTKTNASYEKMYLFVRV